MTTTQRLELISLRTSLRDTAQVNFTEAQMLMDEAQTLLDQAIAEVPNDAPAPPIITLVDGMVHFAPAPEGYELETLVPSNGGGWSNGHGANPCEYTGGGSYKARYVQRGPGQEYAFEGVMSESNFT